MALYFALLMLRIAPFCNIIEDFNAVKDALPHANKPYEKCGCISHLVNF